MKNLLVLFLAMLLFACTNKSKDPQTATFVEEKLAAFIDINPEWDENEAEVTDKFKRKAIHWSNEADFLKNMPLRLQKIVDTTESGQAVKMAHFNAFLDDKRNEESLLNHMQLHIKGIVSEAQVARLKIGAAYLLSGSLQRQGKRADVKFVKSAAGNSYDLGSYTFFITDFKAIK
jgi:BioD-like phosphotransacetylase family protein